MQYKKSTWFFSFGIVAAFGFMFSLGSEIGYAIPLTIKNAFGALMVVFCVAGYYISEQEKKKEEKTKP